MLFPHVLLLLSASPRMSGFIFQVRGGCVGTGAHAVLHHITTFPSLTGALCFVLSLKGKLPLTGMTMTKLEDCEAHKNAFELSGKVSTVRPTHYLKSFMIIIPFQ